MAPLALRILDVVFTLPGERLSGQAALRVRGRQRVVPVATPEDVAGAQPDPDLLAVHGHSERRGASMPYVSASRDEAEVVARSFSLSRGNGVEDPATASARANLGGRLPATADPPPSALRVRQRDAVGRTSELHLELDAARAVRVGGRVDELGGGVLDLGSTDGDTRAN